MAIGEHGEEITISMEEAMAKVRSTRDSMLEMYVDYYQSKPMLWNALTDDERQQLTDYRQALLDLPSDYDDPYEAMANLPTIPSWLN